MNEAMVLAEDNSLKIMYQDTDSMHVVRKHSAKLASLYKEKYGRDLIGSGEGSYGQFSSDFEFDQAWHRGPDGKMERVGKSVKTQGEVCSHKAIFLGKKSYIDVLKDEAGNRAYHVRMK
eukprot:3620655-Pleurochrysis_carterae.AAC.1